MSIRKKLVAMLAAVFALCFVLVGCGGDAAKNYVGDWKLVGMEENGEAASSDDIGLMENMGLSVKEDKTFSINIFGDEMTGTWEAKSASEATFTIEGQSVPATLANDVLTLEADGTKMMFERGTASTSSSGATATTGTDTGDDTDTATGADAETTDVDDATASEDTVVPIEQTIVDDDLCTIEVVNKTVDWAGDPGYTLKITNKSDRAFYATAKYGSFSVDGRMVNPIVSETVQPGKYVECLMWFNDDSIESIDQLVNVEGTIEVDDDETYDTLGEYPFAL